MRAGLVVVLMAFVLGYGSTAQAGYFPDLPGSDMLEEATAGSSGVASSSSDAPSDPPDTDRVPAPQPQESAPESVTESAAAELPLETVTEMPGGGGLPLIKDIAPASAPKENIGLLAAIALIATVLWTRFLYRLNTIR